MRIERLNFKIPRIKQTVELSRRLRYVVPALIAVLVITIISACSTKAINYDLHNVTHGNPGIITTQTTEFLSESITLKVVTFNVWGIPLVSPYKTERIDAIGLKLTELNPDIVCFQEVWSQKDRRKLVEQLQYTRLQYFSYFQNNEKSGGLFIISAFPILETYFLKYSPNGKWYKPWHGDWYAGKGVALARIQHPDGIIDVLNTHLVSKYDEQDEYLLQRQNQLMQLADFIERYSLKTSPTLLLGDFNCLTGDTEYDEAVTRSGLLRLMRSEPSIDNIFAVDDANYKYVTLETLTINDSLHINGMYHQLSDHSGYLSTIKVIPKEKTLLSSVNHYKEME